MLLRVWAIPGDVMFAYSPLPACLSVCLSIGYLLYLWIVSVIG